MSQDTFRRRLAALLDEFLSAGGDPFWLNSELSLSGMAMLDALRCDLAEADDPLTAEPRGRTREAC
jgi:hypothetical protein